MLRFTHLLKGDNLSTTSAAAKSLQSCPTLCDPIDGSPPGSAVRGILRARTLKWVAIPQGCDKLIYVKLLNQSPAHSDHYGCYFYWKDTVYLHGLFLKIKKCDKLGKEARAQLGGENEPEVEKCCGQPPVVLLELCCPVWESHLCSI